MSYYNTGKVIPLKAGGTIAINTAVKADSTEGQVVVTSAITDVVLGIAVNAAVSGDAVGVQVDGTAKVTVSGVVTYGDDVMPTSSGAGKCITAAGATAKSFGTALQTSATTGQVIPVLLNTPSVKGPANT